MQIRISKRAESVPPSGIRRFFDIAATMKDVISLGIGEPDFITPDSSRGRIASLRRRNALHVQLGHGRAAPGNQRLSQAALWRRIRSRERDAHHRGRIEALYLAMTALVEPGDEVIVPQPCFVAYSAEVTLAGGVPVTIKTRVEDNFQVTAAQIEAKITPTKACSSAIPTIRPARCSGASAEGDRQVAEKHDLVVIGRDL